MPTPGAPLTEADAHAAFDVLVEHAGASAGQREEFVANQTYTVVEEFRFGGTLGFGGKFYRDVTLLPDRTLGEHWRVSCYPEDRTPERQQAIADTNAALMATLARRADHGAADPSSGS